MADAIKLPGTLIDVVEKYAPGKRLDFPNFGEVCKTTFAKGEIFDFEKVSDDPITVKSKVKVRGDFGESDYIPLFFKPKSEYWDDETADPPVLATDFDEELVAFKQAWMSFRNGDEVAVMLKEGKPVAVVGFADGVPRVGEDIVKISTKSVVVSFDYPGNTDDAKIIDETWPDAYLQMSPAKIYDHAEKGLDGLDLKLLKKADYFPGPATEIPTEYWSLGWGDWPGPEAPPSLDDPYGPLTVCVGGDCTYNWLGLGTAGVKITKVSLWTIKVGPILYAVFGLWFNDRSVSHMGCVTDYPEYPGWIYDGYQRSTNNVYGYERLMVKAAIYKEGIEDAIVASLNGFTYSGAKLISASQDWWPVTPEGVIYQTDLSAKFKRLCFFDAKFVEDAEWLTRPHTKAELEAAGMWPNA